jgi:outer membrane receptor protein involved in Fe transport
VDHVRQRRGLERGAGKPLSRTTKTSFTDGETLSLFGQVIWKLTDTLEATAGVRYTDETRTASSSSRTTTSG